MRHDEDSEAWDAVGYHGATAQGIHGILKDRCLHGSRELPVVYMLASQSAMGKIAEMHSLFRQVAGGAQEPVQHHLRGAYEKSLGFADKRRN